MASGLRKRFSILKRPLSASPVSELCVLREEDEEDDYVEEDRKDEKEAHDVFREGGNNGMMSHSFSSISEHSSASGEDDSEQEIEDVRRKPDDAAGKDANLSGSVKATQQPQSQSPMHSPKASASQNSTPHRVPSTSSPHRIPPRRATSTLSPVKRGRDPSSSSSSGSWLSSLDLSIIVALVSPIGNILTGSDHIKNILLLLFLIYYLHQLIEVPWNLYRMSISSEEASSPTGDVDPYRRAAHTELRRLELFYLVLTVISPFLGATLLRYIATAISGNAATISWFSTSLFVLATGIRPWTHLAERLKSRTHALKAIIEELEGNEEVVLEDPKVEIDRNILELRGKFDAVDKRLADLGASSAREWDDLADAIDAIELSLRKYQNETNKRAQEWDARLGVLETYVLELHIRDKRTRIHEDGETYLRGAKLRAILWNLLALPWTLTMMTRDFAVRAIGAVARELDLGHGGARHGNGKERPNGALTSQFREFRPSKLETIIEEETESQGQDADVIADGPQNPNGACAGSDSSQTVVAGLTATNPGKHQQHYANSATLDLAFALAMRLFGIAFAPLAFIVRVVMAVVELPRTVIRAIVSSR